MTRIAEVRRDTKETQIHVRVDLDGTGRWHLRRWSWRLRRLMKGLPLRARALRLQ